MIFLYPFFQTGFANCLMIFEIFYCFVQSFLYSVFPGFLGLLNNLSFAKIHWYIYISIHLVHCFTLQNLSMLFYWIKKLVFRDFNDEPNYWLLDQSSLNLQLFVYYLIINFIRCFAPHFCLLPSLHSEAKIIKLFNCFHSLFENLEFIFTFQVRFRFKYHPRYAFLAYYSL